MDMRKLISRLLSGFVLLPIAISGAEYRHVLVLGKDSELRPLDHYTKSSDANPNNGSYNKAVDVAQYRELLKQTHTSSRSTNNQSSSFVVDVTLNLDRAIRARLDQLAMNSMDFDTYKESLNSMLADMLQNNRLAVEQRKSLEMLAVGIYLARIESNDVLKQSAQRVLGYIRPIVDSQFKHVRLSDDKQVEYAQAIENLMQPF